MQQQIREEKSIQEILLIVRKNIVLILLLIILGGCCGLGYSFVKKPNYVATTHLTYKAGLILDDGSVTGGTVAEFNIMRAYVDTILDFCDEGVVTERANYYYVQYMNKKVLNADYSFFDFVNNIDNQVSYNAQNALSQNDKNHIVKENISTTWPKVSESKDEFFFSVKYTDKNIEDSKIKCRLLVEAIIDELQEQDSNTNKYFDRVYNEIIPLHAGDWLPSALSDVSKKKLALVGALVGGLLAVAIVYLRESLDNSIKNKEELEEITGVSVLSVIEK